MVEKRPTHLFDEAGRVYRVQTTREIQQDVEDVFRRVFSLPIDWDEVVEGECGFEPVDTLLCEKSKP